MPFGTPLQTQVLYDDENQKYFEEYEPVTDALIQRYLNYRSISGIPRGVKLENNWLTKFRQKLPFSSNLSKPEFLPTMQMLFMEKLNHFFPNHRLLLSDFDQLPTDVEGVYAPVVQTRQRYRMIPCSTYLVTKGWFDIFFPTNFSSMKEIYRKIKPPTSSVSAVEPRVISHADFLRKYAQLDMCTVKSGEIPILEQYENVHFFLS